MLSIGAMSGGQAGYYLGLAREDYYLEGGEPPGQWIGTGALALGLAGMVDADHLYNLFDGLSPDGSRSLIQRQRHAGKQLHRPGWDLTFSAPKSVSALWSQSDSETQRTIQEVHFGAVKTAVEFLEQTAAFTRRGNGVSAPAKIVVATFEHGTSRAMDPQLHTHALLLNLSVRADGSTGTLSSLPVFSAKMAAGALYRAEFAAGLEKSLGVEAVREKSWFEIRGVSKDLCRAFSKRREAIEQQIQEEGITSAKGAAKAAIETRSAKGEASRSALALDWTDEGERVGWSRAKARSLLGSFKRRKPDISEAVSASLSRLMSQGAHFSEMDLTRTVAEESQGRGLSATVVRGTVRQVLEESPDIVKLGLRSKTPRYTLAEVLAAEHEFFKSCDELAKSRRHEVASAKADSALKKESRLNKEQRDAVRYLTQESGDLAIINGIAGSGKTSTLAAAARAWEAQGYEVQGLCLSGRAARELAQGAKIEATTIAKGIYEMDRWTFAIRWSQEEKRLYFDFSKRQFSVNRNTVLVVDEAGMVNTADFARLSKECQGKGAKLVAVGDSRQLQAILGASPFAEMARRFTAAGLTEVVRQKEAWARETVKEFAEGEAKKALAEYAERGYLTVAKTRKEARETLIEKWKASPEAVSDRLILTDQREDAKELNKMAQQARKKELGIAWITVDDTKIYIGDRVRITKTSQSRGINNGDRGLLVAINPLPGQRAATIKLDGGERVSVDLARFPYLDLGYASTTHSVQGETVKEAFVYAGSAMQDLHLTYVQASRSTDRTHFFMTEAEAGPDLADITRKMSRPRTRTTAHEELRRDRGISI